MTVDSEERLYLLFGKPAQVVSLKMDGTDMQTIVADASGTPDGIAVDAVNGYVYWTNMGDDYAANDGYIERVRIDGTGRQFVVPPGGTHTPKQMFLDLPRNLMYWCDREGMRVMRAKTDGSEITVLVQTGTTGVDSHDETRHCVEIAIDLAMGHIYWTQKGPPNGKKGRIFRAGIDLPAGEQADARSDIEVVFDGLPEPIDLEIDHAGHYLYWTDRGDPPDGNTLNRTKLVHAATGVHEILSGGLQEGIGLTLTKSNVIFTADLGGFVRRFDGPNFEKSAVVVSLAAMLTGIAHA